MVLFLILLVNTKKGEGKATNTQSNKSKEAMQTGSDEAPAHCHCQGASSGYSRPGHQYPSVSTSRHFHLFSILLSTAAAGILTFEAFAVMKSTNRTTQQQCKKKNNRALC